MSFGLRTCSDRPSIDFDELAAHNLMRRTALTDMHVEMPEIASIATAFLNAESVKNFTQ